MRKKIFLALLSVMMIVCMTMGLVACNCGSTPAEVTAPKITFESGYETLEIVQDTPEEEYNLLLGVVVTDAYDSDLKATIKEDGGFDVTVVGDYTVTYQATNSKGKTGEASRTVKVTAAPTPLSLEVPKAIDTKWASGVTMNFKHSDYYELTENTTYEKLDRGGVFYNNSDSEIVLDIQKNAGGEAAIITTNGMTIEGRDGANGYLMNVDHQQRVGSTAKSFIYEETEYSVATATFRFMKIPAHGYAIVVLTGMFGEGFDYDGRAFVNKNIIYQYGTSVKLFWADTPETLLTEYVNKQPIVTSNPVTVVALNTSVEDVKTKVASGFTFYDDNQTFVLSDDITKIGTDVTFAVEDTEGYDPATAGDYNIKVSLTDAQGLKTEFVRVVRVSSTVTKITIGDKSTDIDSIVIKQNVEVTYAAVDLAIYTKDFAGTVKDDSYGEAFVIDNATSKVIRIYDGANAKYRDAENPTGVALDGLTAKNYVTVAFNSLQDNETLIVAPRYGLNSSATYSFFMSNRTIGAVLSFSEATTYTFGMKTIKVNKSSATVSNTFPVLANTTFNYHYVMIYTKDYTGEIAENGYGIVAVFDKDNKLIKTYDEVSGAYMDKDYSALTNPMDETITAGHRIKFALVDADLTVKNAATYAFNHLNEGEYIAIFPNDGGTNLMRTFANSNFRSSFEAKTLTVAPYEIDANNVKIGNNSATFRVNKNAPIDNSVGVINVYTKDYTGTIGANSYGIAMVVDKDGKIVKIYDAAGGAYMDADHSALTYPMDTEITDGHRIKFGLKNDTYDFTNLTTANYVQFAFDSLAEGETLIVFPNDGANAAGSARAFANSNRTIGAVLSINGLTF